MKKGLSEEEEMNQTKVEFMHALISTFQAQAPDILVPVCPRGCECAFPAPEEL